ncbi:uncharacterized protein AB675_7508 [Cyphellophora attinorum]|uniref:Uncharacterized protein n=1 Tax=Cyphellophora attinorum TaxID=1664694 RepID=A0A0N1HA27_9EURO|nr:uncharacterized protein AB675_7508 [Phialophora attinorum]KPI40566.1 hypothetical protein AB675_7508 [Phialophora attinorum]
MPTLSDSIALTLLLVLAFAPSTHAFGAGYVARGSHAHGSNYRHGDILMAVYFLHHVHSTSVRKIYFGNWLRDFSQIVDRKAIELVPEPILRAIVAVFAHIQFGYSTGDFEVTPERLGCYRPEEHIDNPKGYDVPLELSQAHASYAQLRAPVTNDELQIHHVSSMKNYVANGEAAPNIDTSRDFIEKQLIAAVACGRAGNPEAYHHLGAALHTLEDFVAHSNWVELCIQMLAEDSESLPHREEMRNVFAFTGGAAKVETKRGSASPLVTGTFGALDLYQSLLGEIDDKLSAMSIPGLQQRMKGPKDSLSSASKALIGLLKGASGADFIKDIASIGETATSDPADWGKLNETPGLLWDTIKPILRVRDKVVQWVYDHLTVDVIANAIAAISSAIDKFVYIALGLVLRPVLKDISAILAQQSAELLVKDQEARLLHGKDNIFDDASTATDPTHSQLCKDHYGHPLNEIAGIVAVQITTSTIKKIIELWQPDSKAAVKPVIDTILETLHHPFNYSKESDLQSLMVAQVFNWSARHGEKHDMLHKQILIGLDKSHQAAINLGEAAKASHTHTSYTADAYADPTKTAPAFVDTGDQPGVSQGRDNGPVGADSHAAGLQTEREDFAPPLQQQATIGHATIGNQPSVTDTDATQQSADYGSSSNASQNQRFPRSGTAHRLTTIDHPVASAGVSQHQPPTSPTIKAPSDPSEPLTATDTTDSQPQIIDHLTRNITSALRPSPSSGKKPPKDLDATPSSRNSPRYSNIFEDIPIAEIVAAPGMGVVLKDSVVSLRMQDEEKLEEQQKKAHRDLGGWEERSVKVLLQQLEAPGRGHGAQSAKIGTFRDDAKPKDGDEDGDKEGKMGKMMGKLKLKKSSGEQ